MSDIYARMKEKRDIWYAMDRSNNEERMMAEEYYKKELMPLIMRL